MAKGSRILLLTLSLQVLGIFIPYILVLQRNIFTPPLPFISQTTSFSPECGIFTFLLIPGSFLGTVMSYLIHSISILEEKNQQKNIEKVPLYFNLLYYFSWVLICATPITFTDVPNKYEWVFTVLILHMIGALLMLCSIIVVVVSQTAIFHNFKTTERSDAYRKYLAIVTVISSTVGIIALIRVGFEELSSIEDISDINTYYLPTKLSFSYITTTLCEWTLIFCNWLFQLTFYNKVDKTEFRLILKRLPIKTKSQADD